MAEPITVVLAMNLAYTYARDVFRGVASYARERPHWRLSYENSDIRDRVDAVIAREHARGVIEMVTTAEQFAAAQRCPVPLVNVSNVCPDWPGARVASDDLAVGQLAAEHLLEMGHRTFGYMGYVSFGASQSRHAGFSAAVTAAGRTCHLMEVPYSQELPDGPLDAWLERLPPPAGVMASNDALAARLVRAVRARGLRVPEDIAVIGVDNDDLICELLDPPLTSVQLDTLRIGRGAAALLEDLIAGRPAAQNTVQVPPVRVVPRASTAAVAVGDPVVSQALAWMREHIQDRHSIADLAKALHVSRRSLEQWFRAAINRSPGEEYGRLRIERAKYLLAETSLKLAAIAEAAGFSSETLLCRTFRLKVGQTPIQYRQRFRH